jgi:hypothetical protein
MRPPFQAPAEALGFIGHVLPVHFGWEPKLQSPISDLHTLGLRISTPATPLLQGGGAACAPQSPPEGGEGLHLKRMANSPAASRLFLSSRVFLIVFSH